MDSFPHPETIADLRKKFPSLQNPNLVHRSRLTHLEKLAVFITEKIGSMGFFFIILGWTIIWMAWNLFAPTHFRFDPYPAFVLWLFISNLIQIHLMPLIMVGQNIQGQHAETRAELDFATNQKAEAEIESILTHLEHQQHLIVQILHKIEALEKTHS